MICGLHRKHLPVFNILISKRIIRVRWFLVTVRALFSSLTFSFHPERANVWSVPLVVRTCPGQLH
jgi:hypothetical protein